jgi:lyso-ornithine lipid O-acyltransferase
MVSPTVAALRFAAFVAWTLLALPPYLVLMAAGSSLTLDWTRFYWRVVIRLLGFEVVVRGQPALHAPILYVANHASYLDIIVLGSVLKSVFVAKREVAGWPGFGFLARIAGTVFIERRPGRSAEERDLLRKRLEDGTSLILFAEGTSNDGNRMLPFKSSLFAVAERGLGADGTCPLPVQPVSVAYARLDGLPLGRALRPFFAWYGDMTLAGHLPGALGLGRLTVEVEFHPAVTLAEFGSRKALANHCHDVIGHGLSQAIAGRGAAEPPARMSPAAAPPPPAMREPATADG